MKHIEIYTDGACSGNPGPGGWGAILRFRTAQKVYEKELSGGEANTTNNRMELTAPIMALTRIKEPCEVKVYSDSSYLVNAFRQHWLENWVRRGWLKADKKPVENQDLWQELLRLSNIHKIEWIKVKGHADNPLNNRCDELATGEIRKNRV